MEAIDTINTIVSAISIAATAGLKSTAEDAVKDAYTAFKALLLRKFGKSGDTADAVEKVEKKPDSEGRKATLKEELTAAGAHEDKEVVARAAELLELLESTSPGITGGLVGQINADKVVVVGHNKGTINM